MHGTRSKSRTKYLYRKTVNGTSYLYFRMQDGKLVSLPLDQSSAEFKRCYDACLKARGGKTAKRIVEGADQVIKHAPFVGGTFGKAVEVYKRSPEWQELRPSTRHQYVSQLEVLLEHLAPTQLNTFDLDAVNRYSKLVSVPEWVKRPVRGTVKKVRRGGTAAADTQVLLISNIWQVCQQVEHHGEFGIKNIPNPTRDAIKRHTKTKHPAKPWTEDQQDQFWETAPDHLTLGYLMLKYFGQRGGDAVAVLWTDFVKRRIENRWVEGILVAPEKGSDREPLFCELPKRLLDAIKRKQKTRENDAPTILTTAWGTPWSSANALSAAIRNHLIEIGLAARFTKTISMHGLRKNAAQIAARTLIGGVDGVMSMTLHTDPETAKYYAEQAAKEAMRSAVVAKINQMEADYAAAKVRSKRASIRRVK